MNPAIVTALATDGPAARGALTPRERDACARLVGSRRRGDWRAGRLAAKRAAAGALAVERAAAGAPRDPPTSRIEVTSGTDGAPRLRLLGAHGRGHLTGQGISISHRDGRAAAAVAPPGVRVGIDLERTGSVDPASARYFLSAEERSRMAGRDATPLWCLKEAAWKALGLGRSLPLGALELLGGGEGRVHAVRVEGASIPVEARLTSPRPGWLLATVSISTGEA